MWNEVVDLLNHKFPDSLNFVSITLYILRNWDKKRTTRRLQSASQNSSNFAPFDTLPRLFQSLLNFQILNQDKQSDNNESTEP